MTRTELRQVVDEKGGVAQVARAIGLRSHSHLSLALSREEYFVSPSVAVKLWLACEKAFSLRDVIEVICPPDAAELLTALGGEGEGEVTA